MCKFLTRMCLVAWLAVALAGNAQAALSMRLDAADLNPGTSGPGVFDVDVFINWDGNGSNALSSVSFDVSTPAGVTLPDETFNAGSPPPFKNPFNFNLGGVVSNSVGFTNFLSPPDISLEVGDNRLTTLSLNVSATAGTFPIGLTLVQATGTGFADISGDFTAVSGGDLNVVPEPSSFALVGSLFAGVCFRRRRRAR